MTAFFKSFCIVKNMIFKMTAIIIYIILAIGFGFAVGFFSVKFNHLMIILTGRLLSSGHATNRYIIVGFIGSAIVFGTYMILEPASDTTHGIILAVIFGILFAAGVLVADHRFSQSCDILHQIIIAMFSDTKEGNEKTTDAFEISKKMLANMPIANKEALLLLVFFFDSRLGVMFSSLFGRRLMLKRFISMTSDEQDWYIETWSTAMGLSIALRALKSITSFAYFTSNLTWDDIPYNGEILKRSYLN